MTDREITKLAGEIDRLELRPQKFSFDPMEISRLDDTPPIPRKRINPRGICEVCKSRIIGRPKKMKRCSRCEPTRQGTSPA